MHLGDRTSYHNLGFIPTVADYSEAATILYFISRCARRYNFKYTTVYG